MWVLPELNDTVVSNELVVSAHLSMMRGQNGMRVLAQHATIPNVPG